MKLLDAVVSVVLAVQVFIPAVASFSATKMPSGMKSRPLFDASNNVAGSISSLSMVDEASVESADGSNTASPTSPTGELRIPMSLDEMINQVSSAMEDAYKLGKTRQILRILLPRSATNDQLLQYYEEDAEDGATETVLVPTDETWQGGIMQLYRAASYTTQGILR